MIAAGRAAAELRSRARRLRLGLPTLLGGRPGGFFIPYRYAAGLRPPETYPALAPLFREAEGSCEAVVAAIERHAAALLAIVAGPGPGPARSGQARSGQARFDQDWFPRLDAAAAYGLVRETRPARIVEIGSGHSTRFLARAVDDGGLPTAITAIDPAPRAALAALRVRHEPALLDAADPALFAALAPGDILFVDSSHVAMPGTDLDRLVTDILPRLPGGVLVHVHDIFLPEAYPAAWRWRGYNESLLVAALLAGGAFEIVFASRWVATRRPDLLAGIVARLPLRPGVPETSLWLRRRPASR